MIQDRICVLDGRAIVGPSAVVSRRGEAEALIEVLRRSYPIVELPPPACLDWGDVLITEDALFVGLSERSNEAAIAGLAAIVGPSRRVEGVPLPPGLLHLLSGCTSLGERRLLAVSALEPFARARGFDVIPVADTEPSAANILIHGEWAVVPAGYPETAA